MNSNHANNFGLNGQRHDHPEAQDQFWNVVRGWVDPEGAEKAELRKDEKRSLKNDAKSAETEFMRAQTAAIYKSLEDQPAAPPPQQSGNATTVVVLSLLGIGAVAGIIALVVRSRKKAAALKAAAQVSSIAHAG